MGYSVVSPTMQLRYTAWVAFNTTTGAPYSQPGCFNGDGTIDQSFTGRDRDYRILRVPPFHNYALLL